MKTIIRLAFTDFKLIFRDPSLRTFLVLPALLFALVVWLAPYLVHKFDFMDRYIPLILILCVIENTQMFSFISGMVLIDEKENDVAKVYGIVPLHPSQYIVSRFLFPYLFTVLLNVVLFWVQPFYEVALGNNLVISLLAALVVPAYALTLNIIADNRMKGLVYIKVLNMLVLVPIGAFFVPGQLKHLFGLFPTHWIFQSIENLTQGLSFGLYATIGYLFLLATFGLAAHFFLKRHFR